MYFKNEKKIPLIFDHFSWLKFERLKLKINLVNKNVNDIK